MEQGPRQLAVIDMGTTAIRLAVAEARPDGTLRILDRLQQNITLGYETFTRGHIPLPAVEACVDVLKLLTDRLREYRIPADGDHLRVVATSAIREAANREAFIDRIYVATGLEVEVVEESELSRFTYLSIQPFLTTAAFGPRKTTLIVEVGGGSTEVLAVRDGRVIFSQAHELGALRLWQLSESGTRSSGGRRQVMEAQIGRTVKLLQAQFRSGETSTSQIVAIGGDARFAAARIHPGWDQSSPVRVSVRKVRELVEQILDQTEDELVRRYYISYPEAETLGPALLTYVHLAQGLGRPFIYVTGVSMRDGVLAEMAGSQTLTEEFQKQIINSATMLGRRYQIDEPHTWHVAATACLLFDALVEHHGLTPRYRLVLQVAALLHETGMYINTHRHHEHSMYLICNSDLFGMGPRDRALAALVARYHRQEQPSMVHSEYAALGRDERIDVCKLAAILRIADALDRGHAQRVQNLRIELGDGQLRLLAAGAGDVGLERLALEEKSALMEQVFGLQVSLLTVS